MGVLDFANMMSEWCQGTKSVLQILAERESIFRLLPQTTSENIAKDYKNYTIDPSSRYFLTSVYFCTVFLLSLIMALLSISFCFICLLVRACLTNFGSLSCLSVFLYSQHFSPSPFHSFSLSLSLFLSLSL